MNTRAADTPENTDAYCIITAYQEQRQLAGQLTLDQHIGVRIPGGQPIEVKRLRNFSPLSEIPSMTQNMTLGFSPSVQRLV